jgi:hypothetical protein
MSDTITVAHVQQYASNVHMLAQQQGSKLRAWVQEEQQVGKHGYFDRLGPTAVYAVVDRAQPTTFVNSQHTRRRVTMADWQWADTVDPTDIIRILIDPKSAYVVNAVKAMGRRVDETVIAALDGDVFEGETGATVTSFDTVNQEVLSTFDASGDVIMTVAKLREAIRILTANDVDLEMDDVVCALHPNSWDALLGETEFTSGDFGRQRLMSGGPIPGPEFLGMNFVRTTLLEEAAGIRDNFVFVRSAMGLKMGADIMVTVDRLPTLSNAEGIIVKSSFAATRIEDAGVVRILTDEN